MFQWLIIGGGVHGTYMANVLVQQAGIDHQKIRILDPFERPLHRWRQNTANCGMQYLRSPSVHNLDIPILSLYRFGKTWKGVARPVFIPNYNRPALSLFNDHCDLVIQNNQLDTLRIVGRAEAILPQDDHVLVTSTAGQFATRHLLLCLGNSDLASWPDWAKRLKQETSSVHHIFDPHFHRHNLTDTEHTIIVGGGITAAQLALAFGRDFTGQVTLCTRHPIRHHDLDFDPGWVGPKYLKNFNKTPYSKRRDIIRKARNRGSVPTEIHTALEKKIAQARIQHTQARIAQASFHKKTITLTAEDGKTLSCTRLVLATGFKEQRPGGRMLDTLVQEHGLPVASCGYPILEQGILWRKNIFVTGPLAELGLGPCARNIIGVRRAGKELLAYLHQE